MKNQNFLEKVHVNLITHVKCSTFHCFFQITFFDLCKNVNNVGFFKEKARRSATTINHQYDIHCISL